MTVSSGHVNAAEEREKDVEMLPLSHHPDHATRRRDIPTYLPDPDQDVARSRQRQSQATYNPPVKPGKQGLRRFQPGPRKCDNQAMVTYSMSVPTAWGQ